MHHYAASPHDSFFPTLRSTMRAHGAAKPTQMDLSGASRQRIHSSSSKNPCKVLIPMLCLIGPTASAANVIVNGSFENPANPTDNSLESHSSIPGWTPAGSAASLYVVRGNGGVAADWPTSGQDGEQFIDIGNMPTTGIQQTITIPPAFPNPTLTWFDATLGITPGTVFEFSTYSVIFSDSLDMTVATEGFSTNTDVWAAKSLDLPLALLPGTYTLAFIPTSGFTQKDTLIDNVSLVPEPSTLAFLLLATIPLLKRRVHRIGVR